MIVEHLPDIIREYLMLTEHEKNPVLPIYIGDLPLEPDECIAIRLNGSSSSATYLGMADVVGTPLITIDIRSLTYGKGATDSETIRELLKADVTISDVGVVPNTHVQHLGKDSKNRHLFTMYFKTIVKE